MGVNCGSMGSFTGKCGVRHESGGVPRVLCTGLVGGGGDNGLRKVTGLVVGGGYETKVFLA